MAFPALGVKFVPASNGTGDFVYSSTVTGYNDTTQLVDGKTYRYRAENAALTEWEYGFGVWTAASHTLARTVVSFSSTGAKVSFTAAPQVGIVQFVQDLTPIDGYLFGCTLSTAGSSTTFSVTAGSAADSTGIDIMKLAAISKTTASWAVGSGNGGLDTGTTGGAASTWYHAFVIKRPDTGVVDALFSLSPSAPTLPANYTMFRRIGSMLTDGSKNWTKFTQLGDEFLWDVPVADVAGAAIGTTALLTTVTVPTGIQVWQLSRSGVFNGTIANTSLLISSPDVSSIAVGTNRSVTALSAGAAYITGITPTRTNTSAQLRYVADGASSTYFVNTYGWIDTRGRMA